MDVRNLKLEKEADLAESLLSSADKRKSVFKNALFEFVAALLLIALFFYENGELYVKEQAFLELIGNTAVLYLLSTLFDNNYRIKGKLVGLSSEKYKSALERFNKKARAIPEERYEELRERLECYERDLNRKARNSLLLEVGITGVKYDGEYADKSVEELKKLGLSRSQVSAIKRARMVKVKAPTLYELLSESDQTDKNGALGKSMKRLDVEHNVRASVSYLLSALVFAYFAVGLSKDLTLAAFGWYMLKVCFLAFKGIASYFESYLNVSDELVKRLDGKAYLIDYLMKNECQKRS